TVVRLGHAFLDQPRHPILRPRRGWLGAEPELLADPARPFLGLLHPATFPLEHPGRGTRTRQQRNRDEDPSHVPLRRQPARWPCPAGFKLASRPRTRKSSRALARAGARWPAPYGRTNAPNRSRRATGSAND